MLDQVIYTHCLPSRLLKNKGQVMRNDGYGVFSMSPELFSNKRITDYDFLEKRLAIPNGAKETYPIGLFNSYEYSMIAPDLYALFYEVARPHCKILRSNGKSHRSGTFIKQGLIGDIEGYPPEWFGSTVWDAHLKSENDYYLDDNPNAVPDFLPQVSNTPVNGYMNTADIKKFVSDGRAEAVQAGIWFLLRELGKPEEERKVLLIKDTPDHVELWIAAIEYGFSASMAQKITFTTNRSHLSVQTDSILFYYTDDAGRFYPMMDRSLHLTRHPYCMIVGYHPKDNFCSGLKQTPMSNFVIIDGTSKTIGFQTDATIHKPYYSAVIQYDADIQDFCNIVLPSLPCQGPTSNLPELFDAYKYLLDFNHKSSKWNYADAVYYFGILLQYGILSNSALNDYLVKECLTIYPCFYSEDERKEYPLLKHMWNIAKAIGRERDITSCIANIVSNELKNLADCRNGIATTWQALNASNLAAVLQPVLRDLFNDAELSAYAGQFKNSDSASVETVLNMFFYMLSSEKIVLATISETNEKYNFICLAIIGLLNDRNRLLGMLKKLNAVPDLLNGISLSVAQYLEKYEPAKTVDWWDTIMDVYGGSMLELSRRLCASKSVNIEMVEQLLASKMERIHRFDSDLEDAFSEAIAKLGKNSDTGKWLFSTWAKVSQPNDFSDIIHAMKKCTVSPQVEEEIFQIIDSKLPYDAEKNIAPSVYREIQQWADSLNQVSKGASFYEFKRNFVKERKIENALNLAYTFADKKFTVNKWFLASQYFADIIAVSSEFCDAELHTVLLCLFQGIDDTSMEYYVNEYVAKILSVTKSRNMVPQLVSLCEATMYKFKIPSRTAEFVSNVQRILDASFSGQIVEYYKPALVDQVSRYNDCEQNVRNKLILMLEDAKEKATPKRFGGLFTNLFRKR